MWHSHLPNAPSECPVKLMIEFHLEWASKSDQTRHRRAGATTSAPRGLALAFGNETIALPMRPLKFHKSFREHGLIPESISVPCSCSRDAAAGNVGSGKQERRPDAHVQKTSLSLSLCFSSRPQTQRATARREGAIPTFVHSSRRLLMFRCGECDGRDGWPPIRLDG